jgi:NADH:ubiquinone oxidoreductase subunit E
MSNVNLKMDGLDEDLLLQLDQYIEKTEDPKGSLINILHKAQHLFGYLPHNLQYYVARKINIDAATVNGVVSFYSYFTEKKTGKHVISVCMGTACYVKGAEKILHKILKDLDVNKGDVTKDELFTVRDVRCIGACGLAPVLTVGEKVFGKVKEDMVDGILNQYKEEL